MDPESDSMGSLNPDPDPGGQKDPEKYKTVNKLYLLKCWMFSMRADGFSCSLDGLYEGLRISKISIFDQTNIL